MRAGKGIFRGFLAIYVSFLIFMLLLLIPSYYLSLKEVEKRTISTLDDILAAGLDEIDQSLATVSAAGNRLYGDQSIFSLFNIGDTITPTDGYRILEALNHYRDVMLMMPLVADSGLYMRNHSLIATARYYQDASEAYRDFIYCPQIDSWEEWKESLGLDDQAYSLTAMEMVTPRHECRDTVIFALTLPLNANANKAFFYAIYDRDTLLEQLLLPEYTDACQLTLSDRNGVPLITYGAETIENGPCLTQTSNSYHLNATLKIDSALFSQELRYFRRIIWLGVAVYALVAVMLAVAYSWRSAKPMEQVLDAAEKTSKAAGVSVPAAGERNYKNSYRYLHALLHEMGAEVADSRQLLAEQFRQLRESVFEQLLRGDDYEGRMRLSAEKCFPNFPACCRMLLISERLPGSPDIARLSATRARILQSLQSHLPSNAITHTVADPDKNQVVVLLPCQPDTPRAECESLIAALSADLRENPPVELDFTVSPPFSGMEKMAAAFGQLRHLRHLVGGNGERVIYARDIPLALQGLKGQSSAQFYEMLARGECDVAVALMNRDVAELKSLGNVKETEVQQLFFLYRHDILRAWAELLGSAEDCPLPDYQPQATVDESFEKLRDCCRALGERIQLRRERSEKDFEREILAFIRAHLSDPGLCIRLVTDQFGLSENNLRRLLLKHTGQSFQEYVEGQRMTLAQELLSGSDMPVGQIPSRCGYASANSFYKAFRRRFNQSPTAMRTQHQESDDDSSPQHSPS